MSDYSFFMRNMILRCKYHDIKIFIYFLENILTDDGV